MCYKHFITLAISRLPWPALLALLELINRSVDLRLWREEAGRGR
ncbi:hypothetical protein [Calidithermus timidus]|jgi:hypothetical protein|nr:hypothetical protein [Calidithermus timidus]